MAFGSKPHRFADDRGAGNSDRSPSLFPPRAPGYSDDPSTIHFLSHIYLITRGDRLTAWVPLAPLSMDSVLGHTSAHHNFHPSQISCPLPANEYFLPSSRKSP